MAGILDGAVKNETVQMEDSGAIICGVYLTHNHTKKPVLLPFRLDTGADRTFMSIHRLIKDLGYTAKELKNIAEPYSGSTYLAGGKEFRANYIKIPEIWFLGKCFYNCPVFIDANEDFEKIENDILSGAVAIEDVPDNLLGLEIASQFIEVLDYERWRVDFYSIKKPAKDLCAKYSITVGSIKLNE